MSAINELEANLQKYWQLEHHRNPALASCLKSVQSWQKQRMQNTHEVLFSEPNHVKLSEYFLNQLYGGEGFEDLARQLERILPKAKKIQRIVPNKAIETGNFGISLAVMAVELDEAVASYLLANELDVKNQNLIKAYQELDQRENRQAQMALLSKLCYGIDKYVRSFMIKKAFDLAKGSAHKHGLGALYTFIGDGFDAMKPIKSMKKFVEPFCDAELKIIEQVHDNKENPFVVN